MKILVAGGMGFIGSHTCVELIQAGYEPVIVDNLVNSNAEVLDRIEHITGVRPAFFEQDVGDRAALRAVFQAHEISAVIHFAGLSSHRDWCSFRFWRSRAAASRCRRSRPSRTRKR